MKKGWAFASGILVGSVGLSVLTSKLVMKGYKYVFAGAMIARDRIMADSEKVQAAVSNISAEAKEITEQYYQKLDKEYEAEKAEEEAKGGEA
jgi:hypothetical protein